MDYFKLVAKEVAEEEGIDWRIVNHINRSAFKFLRDIMEDDNDKRPLRLPYIGAFSLRYNRHKDKHNK